MEEYQVAIVGAGPGGLTTAIYLARARINTIVIASVVGGKMTTTPVIENYPGFPEPISGLELSDRMQKQAEAFGV